MKWLVVLVLAGCGVDERPIVEPTRFAGKVDGSNALVFVVADPSLTSAFACDGTTSPALFQWFSAGTAAQMTLTSDDGTATLAIDLDAGTGTLGTQSFSLAAIDDSFGLYRGSKIEDDRTYEAGIVLLDDATQNGVVGITEAGALTTLVTPRISTSQVAVTLLNGVRIPLAIVNNAYVR